MISPGAAPRAAEARKRQTALPDFVPLAFETIGVLGQDFDHLIQDLGRRITEKTGNAHKFHHATCASTSSPHHLQRSQRPCSYASHHHFTYKST
ncbi:hypothetical protein Pcinc_020562 [Petrolisthes cinctipes]|uniref:Uncharacterized protein n=1 Tax=Petrolisthes cinctipes TaxID=88211 RepID=A0AAE1FHY0_PETCI|nr:hypothetical protein Pcinc_020562 [Petrolisthes cinctipes]